MTEHDPVLTQASCLCSELPDFAIVPMGMDGLDERVFASLEKAIDHGGSQWWLYVANCRVCAQNWMIAQDSRIYDNHYLRRITPSVRQGIEVEAQWPDEFLTYEKVLRLGRTMSRPWTWLDPRSSGLVWTAEDLQLERPDITIEEIAYLLAIPVTNASRLLQKPSVVERIKTWLARR